MHFGQVHPLVPAVKYQALAAGKVDVIDGYSTDGLIARYQLVVLRDDRHFFPPYEAAALVGEELARSEPGALVTLGELSGRLDEVTMRALNRRVEVDGEPVAAVAASALQALGLLGTGAAAGGLRSSRRVSSTVDWPATRPADTLAHLLLVGISLAVALPHCAPAGRPAGTRSRPRRVGDPRRGG